MDKDYVFVSEIAVNNHLLFYSSLMVMMTYWSTFFFLNLRKKQKDILVSNRKMDDHDCWKLAAESKRKGYKILINSMVEYQKEYQNDDFENFLRIYWPQDYEIVQKNKIGDYSCKRSYSDWKHLFKLTTNKLKKDSWEIID
jgi:hypothetical protein